MSVEQPFEVKLEPVDEVERPLTFALSVWISGKAAWPVEGDPTSLEIQIDDLFSYLVEFWRPLLLRQTYPFGLTPSRPSLISRLATERWETQPQEVMDDEAATLTAFEEAHDLSRAFGGVYDLPHFWMVREGDKVLCDTGRRLWAVPFDACFTEFAAVGNRIADYLTRTAPDKWDRVVDAWHSRDQIQQIELVAWSAGVDEQVADELVSSGLVEAPSSLSEAVNDNDPLLIAARMAGELPTEQIIRILEIAKSFKEHGADRLDDLGRRCRDALALLTGNVPAHSQGEAAAREVRSILEKGPSEPIDVFALVADLGVDVRIQAVDPSTFDGLAIAGGGYGPGAFLNAKSRRLGRDTAGLTDHSALARNAGARVTLAHELCHLLLDREHALSAVEVLRSRMPASIEARAKAFAGEFLLPTSAAADLWDRAGSPTDPDELQGVLQELADRFGVSFSVAAWKLEHGSGGSRQRIRGVLDMIAPYR
jgi:hypothetical protein